MIGACIRLTESWSQQQWDYVLVSFGLDPANVWVRGGDPLTARYENPLVETVAEIGWDGPIVVLAAENGRWVSGDESLVTFQHPADALYVFGGDTYWLSDEDLGGVEIAHKVFIPAATADDLYSFVAGGIAFYDRLVKHG